MLGHRLAGNVAPRLYFLSDIFRDLVSPMLQRVEGHDANRIIELPGHEIVDDGFEIGALDLGLAVNGPVFEAVDHEIDRLIRTVRNGTRRPARSGHGNTPTQQVPEKIKPTRVGSFRPLSA